MNSDDHSPKNILNEFMAAMTNYDATNEGQDGFKPSLEHGQYIIHFLWAVGRELIDPVTYVVATDAISKTWSSRLHRSHIISNLPYHELTERHHTTTETRDRLADGFTDVAEILREQKNMQRERDAEKQKGFKKLAEQTQQMILFATSTNGETVSEKPNELYDKFLKKTTVGAAASEFRNYIKKSRARKFVPAQSLVTAIHQGNLLWLQDDIQ
ncbi:MAG: hypothetical protein ACREOZ_04335 [Gloeomargaritales cyanobacterium]